MSDGFKSWEELKALPPQTWLVEDHIPEGGQTLLYGPSGHGKSFVAMDWALCVATGRPWLGKYAVKQGAVVYIAAEGATGIPKRVAAWLQERSAADDELTNMLFRLKVLDIYDDYAVGQFLLDLEARYPSEPFRDPETGEVLDTIGSHEELRLVVVDTLARTYRGESENDNAEMSKFLDRMEWVRNHGASLLLIHHSGKTGTERGATALRAAMEAVFKAEGKHSVIKSDGRDLRLLSEVVLENNKQKDDAEGKLRLEARRVEIAGMPPDRHGRPQTSVVLDLAAPLEEKAAPKETGPRAMSGEHMLRLLAASENGYTFSEWQLAAGMDKDQFKNRLNKLRDAGRVVKHPLTNRWRIAVTDDEEDDVE